MRRHRDQDIIVLEEEGGSGLTWLLVGAAVGATLALLFAPGSGEENRRALGRQARRLRRSAEDALDVAQDRFDALRSGWLEGEEDDDEEEEATLQDEDEEPGDEEEDEEEDEEGEGEVSSARRELERRLARARARRAEPLPEEEEPVA